MKVNEAFEYLIQEEEQRLIDMDQVTRMAIDRVENSGIVFLDEIDKIAGARAATAPTFRARACSGDILPIVEGTTVKHALRHGAHRSHFVYCGGRISRFEAERSDSELQGRFPIRVELQSLTMEDFVRILTEPKSVAGEAVHPHCLKPKASKLEFTPEALSEIAHFAFRVNESTENIGARRLHTIMERVLDELSFDAPERKGDHVTIDADYVRKMLTDIVKDQDCRDIFCRLRRLG